MLTFMRLIICFSLCGFCLAQDKVLSVAYYNAYPHMYEKEGLPVGPGIRYMRDIAQSSGVSIEFKFYPVKRAVSKLMRGEIDIVLGLIKTQQRQDHMQFSKHPVVSATPCLITNHEIIKTKQRVLQDGGILLLPHNFIIETLVSDTVKNFDLTYVHDRRPMKKIVDLLEHRPNVYGLIQVCIPDFYERKTVRAIPLNEDKSVFYLGFSNRIDKSIINSFDDNFIMMEEKGRGYMQYLKAFILELN